MVDKFIIFGASSEIAIEFIKICKQKKLDFIPISRETTQLNGENINILDYLDDFDKYKHLLSKFEKCNVIFFNGSLLENRPVKIPTADEINKMNYINHYLPVELTKKMSKDFLNINKFIYISSMAAVRLRPKNPIYGESKQKLELSVKRLLDINSFLIIRFGKVFTKMSIGHKTPPFSMSSEIAAQKIFLKINKNGIRYPNFGLLIISIVLKILPNFVIRIAKY